MTASVLRILFLTILAGAVLMPACSDNTTFPVPPGFDAECIRFEDYVHLLSRADVPGDTRRAVRKGDVIYVADGASGVQVVDIGNPGLPLVVGSVPAPGQATDVAVDGDHLYIATRTTGMRMYDISDSLAPVFTGEFSTAGQVLGLVAADTLLYMANDGIGLQVLSVSDPANPHQIAAENTPGQAQDVVVSGDIAYVSDATLGLRVISIAVPAAPVLLATLTIPGLPQGLASTGDLLYIASVTDGLQVVDVADPRMPFVVGGVPMPGGVRDVDVNGDWAYAADRLSGVRVLDISTRDAPVIVTTVAVRGDAEGVNVAGELLLASAPRSGVGENGLKIIDISNPAPPPIVSIQSTPDVNGQALGVFRVGDAVYVCDGPAGVQVADISDPEVPVYVDNISLLGAKDIAVQGSIAYVAGEHSTLQVDVSDPFAPIVLSSSMNGAESVAVSGDIILLAQGLGGVSVYRSIMPGNVEFVQSVGSGGTVFAADVTVYEGYAYVAWGTFGVQVIDIARLGTPIPPLVGSASTSQPARVITTSGERVLVASHSELEIMSIGTPISPALLGSVEMPSISSFVAVGDGSVYLAGGSGGVHVVDFHDPANPTLIGSLHSGGTVLGVDVDRFFVYAADRDDGLIIMQTQCE